MDPENTENNSEEHNDERVLSEKIDTACNIESTTDNSDSQSSETSPAIDEASTLNEGTQQPSLQPDESGEGDGGEQGQEQEQGQGQGENEEGKGEGEGVKEKEGEANEVEDEVEDEVEEEEEEEEEKKKKKNVTDLAALPNVETIGLLSNLGVTMKSRMAIRGFHLTQVNKQEDLRLWFPNLLPFKERAIFQYINELKVEGVSPICYEVPEELPWSDIYDLRYHTLTDCINLFKYFGFNGPQWESVFTKLQITGVHLQFAEVNELNFITNSMKPWQVKIFEEKLLHIQAHGMPRYMIVNEDRTNQGPKVAMETLSPQEVVVLLFHLGVFKTHVCPKDLSFFDTIEKGNSPQLNNAFRGAPFNNNSNSFSNDNNCNKGFNISSSTSTNSSPKPIKVPPAIYLQHAKTELELLDLLDLTHLARFQKIAIIARIKELQASGVPIELLTYNPSQIISRSDFTNLSSLTEYECKILWEYLGLKHQITCARGFHVQHLQREDLGGHWWPESILAAKDSFVKEGVPLRALQFREREALCNRLEKVPLDLLTTQQLICLLNYFSFNTFAAETVCSTQSVKGVNLYYDKGFGVSKFFIQCPEYVSNVFTCALKSFRDTGVPKNYLSTTSNFMHNIAPLHLLQRAELLQLFDNLGIDCKQYLNTSYAAGIYFCYVSDESHLKVLLPGTNLLPFQWKALLAKIKELQVKGVPKCDVLPKPSVLSDRRLNISVMNEVDTLIVLQYFAGTANLATVDLLFPIRGYQLPYVESAAELIRLHRGLKPFEIPEIFAYFRNSQNNGLNESDEDGIKTLFKYSNISEYSNLTDDVTAICLSKDGNTLYTGSFDGTIMSFRLGMQKRIVKAEACISAMQVSDIDSKLIATFVDGKMYKNGKWSSLPTYISSIICNYDGDMMLAGFHDGTISNIYASNLKVYSSLAGHKASGDAIVCCSDQFAVGASFGNNILVFHRITLQIVATLVGHEDIVTSVFITSDNSKIISGSYDNTIRVWDTKTFECLACLTGHSGVVFTVKATSNCKRIVSVSDDDEIRIWDMETFKCIATYSDLDGCLAPMCISRDDTKIYSASAAKSVKVWRIV